MQRFRALPAFAFMLLTATLVAGCSKSDNDPGPGGVSIGEARALDEAAEMIESRRPPADRNLSADQAATIQQDSDKKAQ